MVGQTHESSMEPRPLTIDLAFEESFDALYSRAYGVAFQLLGVRTEAEDVAQETLARAFVHWRKVRTYPEAWVVRVASNLSIDTWRRNRRFRSAEAPESLTPGPEHGTGRPPVGRSGASRDANGRCSCCASSPTCPKPTSPRPSAARSAR